MDQRYLTDLEKQGGGGGYVDCNFNWTNIDMSPDTYHDVVDISQSDIYQFDMTAGQTTVFSPGYAYDQPGSHPPQPLDPAAATVVSNNNNTLLPADYPMEYTTPNALGGGGGPHPSDYSQPPPTPSKKGKGGRKKSLRPPSPTILKLRREAANARERKRMNGLNDAFERLREVVPNLTAEQKMSKIETLRMAQAYIKSLAGLIETETAGDCMKPAAAVETVEVDMFELI